LLQAHGLETVGIYPTEALINRARQLDPQGDYRLGRAETLDATIPDAAFDLVVSYLTLIDIADLELATARMVAAMRPGGTLLIANLNSFNTSGMPDGWTVGPDKKDRFCIDHYLDERPVWLSWRGIRIENWHRPLSRYMELLLGHRLELRHFSEPAPSGGDPQKAARYRRVPYFHIMEWRKPATSGAA
jgi:hypothetical protein